MTVIPEFVSGVVLLYVFAVWLKWLPVSALPPDGAPFYERLYYLILPAIPLMFLELGYIAQHGARGHRAGAQHALHPHRGPQGRAAQQGRLRPRAAQRPGPHGHRHRQPGRLAARRPGRGRELFIYPGIGRLMVEAALSHDIPLLEASVLLVAVVYMLANLIADIVVALLNPRIRMGG